MKKLAQTCSTCKHSLFRGRGTPFGTCVIDVLPKPRHRNHWLLEPHEMAKAEYINKVASAIETRLFYFSDEVVTRAYSDDKRWNEIYRKAHPDVKYVSDSDTKTLDEKLAHARRERERIDKDKILAEASDYYEEYSAYTQSMLRNGETVHRQLVCERYEPGSPMRESEARKLVDKE